MKKLLLLSLFAFQCVSAQDQQAPSEDSPLLDKKNEFRVDVLSLVASSKLNLSYERFLSRDFSAGVSVAYSKSGKIDDEFDSGYRNTRPEYEIMPYVRYKMAKSMARYYFAEIFVSANGGDFKEVVRLTDENGNGYYVTERSTYADYGVGAGLGYKMYLKEKFAIELLVGFGTNLFEKEKSPDTLSRVGLSLGYRF